MFSSAEALEILTRIRPAKSLNFKLKVLFDFPFIINMDCSFVSV